jgi:DNA-binding transcriptional MerR regulator
MAREHSVGEVAALLGVTVRTLQHYDRIGLLRPARRSDAGYRWYDDADLLRLQQIVTLRQLGFSLARIAALLARPDVDLAASLQAQRLAIRRRVADLERIDAAIADLLAHRAETGDWDWATVERATAANRLAWQEGVVEMERFYTPEQLAEFAALGDEAGPAEIAEVERLWMELIPEIRAARAAGLDPGSPDARRLLERADALRARTFRGRTGLEQAVRSAYAAGAFAANPDLPTEDDFAFLEAARRAADSEEKRS